MAAGMFQGLLETRSHSDQPSTVTMGSEAKNVDVDVEGSVKSVAPREMERSLADSVDSSTELNEEIKHGRARK